MKCALTNQEADSLLVKAGFLALFCLPEDMANLLFFGKEDVEESPTIRHCIFGNHF